MLSLLISFCHVLKLFKRLTITLMLSLLSLQLMALQLPIEIEQQDYLLELELSGAFQQNDQSASRHYHGKVVGQSDSWLRVSHMSDGRWLGLVFIDGQAYQLNKAASSVELKSAQTHKIATASLMQASSAIICGSEDLVAEPINKSKNHSALFINKSTAMALQESCQLVDGVCAYADLELVIDQEFQAAFGNNLSASVDSLLNMVEGYYRQQLNISFNKINSVLLTNASDIYSDSKQASTFLQSAFSRRCEQQEGTAICTQYYQNYDKQDLGASSFIAEENSIVHILTGRDFNGSTAGIAFTDAYCGIFAMGTTSLIRNYNNSIDLVTTAAVMAHELGHNLGSLHDGDGNSCASSGYVMQAYTSSLATEFSSCSVPVIKQSMADNKNNESCSTAPIDIVLEQSNLNLNATVGQSLTINNLFALQQVAIGFRSQAEIEIKISAIGAEIESAQFASSACTLANDKLSAVCVYQVPSNSTSYTNNNQAVQLQLMPTANSVTLTSEVLSNKKYRDVNTNNSNRSVTITASSAGNANSIIIAASLFSTEKRPLLSGQTDLANGQTIVASINGQTICSTQVTGSQWSCQAVNDLADGHYTVNFTSGGTASNAALVIDSIAPEVTANSFLSNQLRPILSGTVDLSAQQVLVKNAQQQQICQAVIEGESWSCQPTTNLVAGQQNLTVEASDQLGNKKSISFQVELDLQAPKLTAENLKTQVIAATIYGTTDLNSNEQLVVLDQNEQQLCLAQITGSNWNCRLSSSLSIGSYQLIAQATDTAGNVTRVVFNYQRLSSSQSFTNSGDVSSSGGALSFTHWLLMALMLLLAAVSNQRKNFMLGAGK